MFDSLWEESDRLIAQEKYQDAIDLLMPIWSKNLDDVEIITQIATAMIYTDIDKSLYLIDGVLQMAPDYGYAYYIQGVALERLGKTDLASSAFEKGHKIIPSHLPIFRKVCYAKQLVVQESGNLDLFHQAIQSYTNYLEQDPQNYGGYHNRAELYHQFGYYDNAMAA
ncbi:hypothetical protein [Conservatibacter flavescens]|uniref:Uncharacterized protein n=1 Tax=Conservatibacter flavescens TaxID=28161 RepID=A0A2M8S1D8_9PAST|nr:hypothetical protein [Conservatibacter flavescens]PJG84938.1 hypothetical protein CVP05_08875 [Conservatibacter flavescens]